MGNVQGELARLYQQKRDNLLRLIRRKLYSASEMDVEDILQEVFVNLFNKADVLMPVENLAAYVYASVSNKITDYIRKGRNTLSIDALQEDEEGPGCALPDERADLERQVEERDFRERLFLALDELEPKQRAVWIATEIEGIAFKELSKRWNEPIGTLLSRKSRATAKLKKALTEYATENY